ncbi:siderophore iron transporter [Penicillium canescens]|uniref:Siderophore iron transporter n=1 Tax=Penicillium canescens TaxID=5083 RepID=A0AAD6N771_PENCN|nr:siderophore iron transporter [Penicillium canescens]KAJ6038236.1 siderophore iron transporter [Penicillium canescens]KAJ6039642.1 siderophore iron transporter [Penicillium canescens]KAJ6068009.1 siderophore iron transporter [Penicillium canescens]
MASQSAIAPSAPEEPTTHVNSKTIICLVAINITYMAQFISLIGSGFLAQSMAQIVGGTNKTVWYSSCIVIMTVALNPPVSQAADYWGRKPILIALSLTGMVGSIIVSRAQNSSTIIAGFAILGLNFGCQSVILAVLSEVLPRQYRPMGQASAMVASSLGAITGLLMGGGMLQHGNLTHYRIYWVSYRLQSSPRELQASLSTYEKLNRLDWIGYFLFAPGLVLFSMALSWSNNPYSWSSANILGPFIIGVVAMILFAVHEWRFKRDGILNHDLWVNRNFAVSLLVIFVEGLAFFAVNSYFAFEITVIYDANILSAGASLTIMFFSGLVFSSVFGLWSSKCKTIRPPLILGCVSLLLFFILLATVKIDTPRYAFYIFPLLSGIAMGSIVPLSMVSAQLTTSPELITLASALMTSVRGLGGAIGLAINNAVLNDTLDKELPAKVGAAALSLGLPSSSLPELINALATQSKDAVAAVPGVTPEIAQAAVVAMKEAYLSAFRNAWVISASFCVVLVICESSNVPYQNTYLSATASCFIREQRADFDARIDAPMDAGLYNVQGHLVLSQDMEKSVDSHGPKGTSVKHEEIVPS